MTGSGMGSGTAGADGLPAEGCPEGSTISGVIVGTAVGVAEGRGDAGRTDCAGAGAASTGATNAGTNAATATALNTPILKRTMFPCLTARSRSIRTPASPPTLFAKDFAHFCGHLQARRFIGHDAFRCDESHRLVTQRRDIPKREA
jgi:hypothetical protein